MMTKTTTSPATDSSGWKLGLSVEDVGSSAAVSPDVALITVLCTPKLLASLGDFESLALADDANTPAVVGLLASLNVDGGILRGPAGNPVPAEVCLGLLGRLGVITGVTASTSRCLHLLAEMGFRETGHTDLLRRTIEFVRGPSARLGRCIGLLEQRGYHVRAGDRLLSVCHPVIEVCSIRHPIFGRRFMPSMREELTVAA